MRKILLPIILACLLWSACTKSPSPDPVQENPVFWISLDVDSSLFLTAGLDGNYLFTRVDRGSDHVLVMSGAFAHVTCPTGDCENSVRFEFRNSGFGNVSEPAILFQAGTKWDFKSPFSDSSALQTVAVQWVGSNGIVLRSDYLPQIQGPDSSYFRIQSSEPWEMNERGETTWKMNVDFVCWVFDSIQLQERRVIGGGTIAVGYR